MRLTVLPLTSNSPLLVLLSIILINPGLNLGDLVILHQLHTGIHRTGLGNQITAVDSTRNDLQRGVGGPLERATGLVIARHGRVLPRVKLAVGPDQTGGVACQIPALGEGVDIVDRLALRAAVRTWLGEEQGTLALPVVATHKARDNGGGGLWSTVLPEGKSLKKVCFVSFMTP